MPGHLIRRAQQISAAIFTDDCAKYDLTPVHYAALHGIDLHPVVDATRLSEIIELPLAGRALLRLVEPAVRRVQGHLLALVAAAAARARFISLLGQLLELHREITLATLGSPASR